MIFFQDIFMKSPKHLCFGTWIWLY